jgi:hypothetical protein
MHLEPLMLFVICASFPEFSTNLMISAFFFRIVDTVLAGILNLAATSFSRIPL